MAKFVCDRCGHDLDSLIDVGTVSIGTMGNDLYGYYVFCPECIELIRKIFREIRLKALAKENK